ncbi:hypothetical protein QZH41_002791 [Actinostola sp. cb2023]|nr:hypothetical protein QZH41_002791 [Actinostola sp. cb2023]
MTLGQVDTNLRRFYTEARTKTGEMYGRSTLLGFRHAIERHVNLPPNNRNIKISTDPRFQRSNLMLDAQLVNMKRSGKDNPVHKPTIEDEDMAKLRSSETSLKSPVSPLCNVWFNVVLFFCRRGREGQRDLTKSSFKFEVDASGRKYVTMAHDELTKNHQGGLKDQTTSTEKYARMYESNHENDGYKALQLYLTKLNATINALFQYPKKNWEPTEQVWYEARPIGENKLDSMMKTISKVAGLSRVYTNHSVRGTAITMWSNAGVPNRHIMAISGHRNEQSLAHYNTRPSTAQLHNCSEVLSRSLVGTSSSSVSPAQSTIQVTTAVQHNNLLDTGTQAKPPMHSFQSMFNNCLVQNVQIVVQPSSNEGRFFNFF